MHQIPILNFAPIMKELVWGGRKLETVLNKTLPTAAPFGESWEVVDLPNDQSRVAGGPFKNLTLEALLRSDRSSILGDAALLDGRFPLLFKFIDARRTLSVQVHPNEAACKRIGGGARPKTEAWYIIDRTPGAKLYVGLKPGVTKETFKSAIDSGKVADLLHETTVSPGDYIFLPAGTIHAIGEGILLAEVQQSSDTTYRVFDWNRVGLDGKPRALHVEQALEATDFSRAGAPVANRPNSGRSGVVCDYFEMETIALSADPVHLEGQGALVLMGVGGTGSARVTAGNASGEVKLGETLLIPNAISNTVDIYATDTIHLLSIRIPR